MEVYGNAMNDIEKQILHDANDFFIRVMALDRAQCLGQNVKTVRGTYSNSFATNFVLGAWPGFKGFISTCM